MELKYLKIRAVFTIRNGFADEVETLTQFPTFDLGSFAYLGDVFSFLTAFGA